MFYVFLSEQAVYGSALFYVVAPGQVKQAAREQEVHVFLLSICRAPVFIPGAVQMVRITLNK